MNCQECQHFGKTCAPFPEEDELAQECACYQPRSGVRPRYHEADVERFSGGKEESWQSDGTC